jgi:hypothetical protein
MTLTNEHGANQRHASLHRANQRRANRRHANQRRANQRRASQDAIRPNRHANPDQSRIDIRTRNWRLPSPVSNPNRSANPDANLYANIRRASQHASQDAIRPNRHADPDQSRIDIRTRNWRLPSPVSNPNRSANPGANLHANIRRASLRRASLRHANLRHASLRPASLRPASLRHASLRRRANQRRRASLRAISPFAWLLHWMQPHQSQRRWREQRTLRTC